MDPVILHDKEDKNLKLLKDNLTKLLKIKESDKGININIETKKGVRTLGVIEGKMYTPKVNLTTTEIRMLSIGNVKEGNVFLNDEVLPSVITDLHTHFTGVLKARDIYVLGGGLFASDLLVNLENENVKAEYDPRLSGASKEYEERRNKSIDIRNMENEMVTTSKKK